VTPDWVAVFAALAVAHLAGDFILQTEFQATHKHRGLGRDPLRRRALALHTLTYTLCHVPVLVWLADDLGTAGTAAAAAAVAVPHALLDDGRFVRWWLRAVKHTSDAPGALATSVDQSFHMVALFALAIVVGR